MITPRIITLLLLCTLFSEAFAQEQLSPRLQQLRDITFDHITTEQGLPTDAAEAVFEDSRGFMWFGTQNGLCRYDGYSMLIYRRDELDSTSISDNFSLSGRILDDRWGKKILIACRNGLNAYSTPTGRFTRFAADSTNPYALIDDHITALCQDHTGRLWIGTANGLNEMMVDSGGHVTFLRHLYDARDTTSLFQRTIFALCEGDDGVMWIGTSRGLGRFDTKTNQFTRVSFTDRSAPDQSANRVQALCKDNSGILWVGTLGGVIRYDPRTGSTEQMRHKPANPHSPGSNTVIALALDDDGILWVGTADAGLNALDTQTGQCIRFAHNPTNPGGLSDNSVKDVYRDSKGSIWVATNSGGINKYERGKRQCAHIRKEPGNPSSLSCDIIWQMVEDKLGSVWIGTSEGLNVYDRRTGKFSHYFHDPLNERSLSHPIAFSLFNDFDGSIWVGGGEGLTRIDPLTGSITRHHNEPSPPHNNAQNAISGIHRDPNGTLWVATSAGPRTVNLREKRFDPFVYRGYTTQVLGDRDGRTLWVASDGEGLVKIDLKTRQVKLFSNNPRDPTSISHNSVIALCEDPAEPERILWLVTFGGGLNRFDKSAGTFTRFAQTDGLADNEFVSMAFDGHGNLWLGGAGLSRFDPKSGVFRNYDRGDGIAAAEPNMHSLLRISTGEIFAGTTKGLTIFHPDSLRDNTHIPPIVLTDFKITNKSVLPGGPHSPLRQTITETKEIVLSYLDNMISFEFAALDYVVPEKNQYAYKLEGFDKDWIRSGHVRTATYTNLDPGHYIFRVKGSNNDGIWNEEGASLSIIITPPWWKTVWAYLAYVLLTGGILYSIYHVQVNRLRLVHRLQLEHIEATKMHELDHLKSRFFANISHEFRTPLTLILGPIRKWKERATPVLGPDHHGGESSNALSTLREGVQASVGTDTNMQVAPVGELLKDMTLAERNAHRLLGLINQLLDLSKLEAGAMKLHASRMNIVPLVKGISYSFESSAGMRKIELEVVANQEEIEVYADKEMVEKILSNLLSNAFKFTPEGGKVSVSTDLRREVQLNSSWSGDCLEITVHDTGAGIPADQLERVFDRFYQVDASQTREHEGSGIGLALVKELVELHHGTVQVQSKIGRGTTFTVLLPLGRRHLEVDEIADVPDSAEAMADEGGIAAAGGIAAESRGGVGTAQRSQDKPLVLIVEDNTDVRQYIRDNLPSNVSCCRGSRWVGGNR